MSRPLRLGFLLGKFPSDTSSSSLDLLDFAATCPDVATKASAEPVSVAAHVSNAADVSNAVNVTSATKVSPAAQDSHAASGLRCCYWARSPPTPILRLACARDCLMDAASQRVCHFKLQP